MDKILILVFLIAYPLLAQQQHFSGSVQRGQVYTHDLGRNLVLRVTTTSIEVQAVPADPRADDYTGCVTPPFHGPNPTDLEAWQFVTDQNELLPESELDQLRRRKFQFTLDAAANKKACDELNLALYTSPVTQKDGTIVYGTPGYKSPPLGTGVVTLRTIELIHVGRGQKAEVQRLDFTVDVVFPPAATKSTKP